MSEYKCSSCGLTKPLTDFNKRTRGGTGPGHQHYCKLCAKIKWNDYISTLEGMVTHRLSAIRNRKVGHSIDRDYLLKLWHKQDGKCYWSGQALTISAEPQDPYQASVDRLDNEKGYVPGNVVWSSWGMNRLRGTMTVTQFWTYLAQLAETISHLRQCPDKPRCTSAVALDDCGQKPLPGNLDTYDENTSRS